MFALTLIIAFAVASAARQCHSSYFSRNIFQEVEKEPDHLYPWAGLNSAEMDRVANFGDIRLKLPDVIKCTEVMGNNYVIKIDAPRNRLWKVNKWAGQGFFKVQVVYKSREGFVTTTKYVDLMKLPPNVDPAGAMWGYMDDVITVNFPYIEAGPMTPGATDDRKGVEFMTDDGEDTNVVMTTTTENNEEEDQYAFEPIYY